MHVSPRELLLATLLFTVLAFCYAAPILQHPAAWCAIEVHNSYSAVAVNTLLTYHQFPLWNPYRAGGTVFLAFPYSRVLSPTFVTSLLWGPVVGPKIETFLHLIIGMLGMYLLGRHYRMVIPAAILAAMVFMMTSIFSVRLPSTEYYFLTYSYFPWAWLFFRLSFHQLKYVVCAALAASLIYFGGNYYLFIGMHLFLVLYSVLAYAFSRNRRHLVVLGCCLSFTLGLSSVKLLPTVAYVMEFPRTIELDPTRGSGYSLLSFTRSLLQRDQGCYTGQKYFHDHSASFLSGYHTMDHWFEDAQYIGLLPFLFCICGLIFYARREKALALSLLALVWLSFGQRDPLGTWTVLQQWYPFSSLRCPQRFSYTYLLLVALFSGFGLHAVLHRPLLRFGTARRATAAGALVLAFIALDLILVNRPNFIQAFTYPPPPLAGQRSFTQIATLENCGLGSSPLNSGLAAVLSNTGFFIGVDENIDDEKHIAAAADGSRGWRGLVFLDPPGTARLLVWTPNTITVAATASRASCLSYNQNYRSGWQATVNGQSARVSSRDGLISVPVPPGDSRVTLAYQPVEFFAGLAVTAISLLIALVFFVRLSRQPVARH